jgi:hypothetical protein
MPPNTSSCYPEQRWQQNSGQNKPAFFPFQLQRFLSAQLLDFFA